MSLWSFDEASKGIRGERSRGSGSIQTKIAISRSLTNGMEVMNDEQGEK